MLKKLLEIWDRLVMQVIVVLSAAALSAYLLLIFLQHNFSFLLA